MKSSAGANRAAAENKKAAASVMMPRLF